MRLSRGMLSLVSSVAAVAGVPPFASASAANLGHVGAVERCVGSPTSTAGVLCGACSYEATLTPANTVVVSYGGAASMVTTFPGDVTHLTEVTCEIRNSTESQQRRFANRGPVSLVADSTATATSGPKEWRVEPVTVCVGAFAVVNRGGVLRTVTVPLSCELPW